MISWSLGVDLVGIGRPGVLTKRLARTTAPRPPELYWLLGLAALLPGWPLAFEGLLGTMTGRVPEGPPAAWGILSSATAVLGVIGTDAPHSLLPIDAAP